MSMASMLRQPPNYILQTWRYEPIHLHDKYLFQQTFIIAPDGAVPFSKLRQRFRTIYEERTKPLLHVHRDSWDQLNPLIISELVKSQTTL